MHHYKSYNFERHSK